MKKIGNYIVWLISLSLSPSHAYAMCKSDDNEIVPFLSVCSFNPNGVSNGK